MRFLSMKGSQAGNVVLCVSLSPAQGMPLDPYMVAFSYGSVVFFNTDR